MIKNQSKLGKQDNQLNKRGADMKDEKSKEKDGFFNKKKKSVTSIAESMIGVQHIKDGANLITSSVKRMSPWYKRKNVRVESFEDSYIRFNLTEKKLEAIYKNLNRKFYMCLMLTVIIIAWMVILAISGKISTSLAALSISLVPTSIAITTAFRMHQIHSREWCTFKEWFDNNDGWWPKKWVKKENKSHEVK